MELEIKNISKTIRGKNILKEISLSLHSGKIYGFVGKNGSGKTMLFRAISGLMTIDSGEIIWDGKVLHRDFSVLPSQGIVIENAGLYPDLTGFENLKYLAGLTGKIGNKEIKHAILRVGLDPGDKRIYKKYSLGMKQRLAIAQAIMESPDVIMLDEPTNALDEEGVSDIRKIVLEEKARGAVILIASHNSEDIRILADEKYYIENGRIKVPTD
ncbi:MAG: ATP-binding cassette domain-containing protein [Bacteroidales bacterium]|nr:ATP-binding cassette domain-containing protein [Lachnoclostridium sp.]MCM1385590.1 ATP-binding cassette domain-containing protein [Lachnoclostridium sp.]MCM1466459.1 ATP-binding cassette domain-containing protein [Bacteroidales bacterium]